MKFIKVKTQFEGFHCWPNAPKEVEFLKNVHRHIFQVVVKIQLEEERENFDRELEFFTVKGFVDSLIKSKINRMPIAKSCEMVASKLLEEIERRYEDRIIEVEVSEDGENSSVVDNKKFECC